MAAQVLLSGGHHGRRREVAQEVALGDRIVRQATLQQLGLQRELGVGQQHAELGPDDREPDLAALGEDVGGGESLRDPIEVARLLEREHQVPQVVGALPGPALVEGDPQALRPVVLQDELGDRLGELLQQAVALVDGHPPGGHRRREQDLEVDLVVGHVDAARVVDRVGVDPTARERVLDPRALRQPEVPTLPDHLAAELRGIDPHGVVGRIAGFGVGLAGRLHVRPDPAVPEELRGRAQDRADQRLAVGRRLLVLGDAERPAGAGRELDLLRAPRHDHPAFAQEGPVVVVPARPPQREEPLALGEGRRRVRVGIDEDVAMIEGRDQPDLLRQQHPVAEDVAAHVPDADDGERLALDVLAHLAEVTLDALPPAPRRDADGLVVVPVGAAGREGVVQPEAVLGRHAVGHVGERGRALVRRHDEVGVGRVVGHDTLGGDGAAVDEVVGQVEQAAHEGLVLLPPLRPALLRVGGRAARDEAALGSAGHDHRVLDHLGLHQPQDLGAEVVGPVAPADPAARDRRAAQVDPLHARRVHPHLEEQLRRTRGGDLAEHELVGDVGHAPRAHARLAPAVPVVARAHAARDDLLEPPQRSVLRQEGHAPQGRVERVPDVGQRARPLLDGAGDRGVELRLEQLEQLPGDPGLPHQRGRKRRPARDGSRLEGVRGVASEHVHLAPVQTGRQHEGVQPVAEHVPGAGREHRLGEALAALFHVERPSFVVLDREHVDRRAGQAVRSDLVRLHRDDLEARVLEDRHEVRQDEPLAAQEDLQLRRPDDPRHRGQRAAVVDHDRDGAPVRGHRLELGDVRDRDLRIPGGLVLPAEGLAVLPREPPGLVGRPAALQPLLQTVGPGSDQALDPPLEIGSLHRPQARDLPAHVEVQTRLDPLAERQVVVEHDPLEGLDQRGLDRAPDLTREALLGQDHHHGQATLERVFPERDPHLARAVRREDGTHVLADLRRRREEELLLGQRVEDRDDLLVVVRALADVRLGEDRGELAPQDRDVPGRLGVRLRREEADEAVLSRRLSVRAQLLDAHVVHARPPVHGRLGVGLVDDQHRAVYRQLADPVGERRHRHGLGEARIALVAQEPEARPRLDHDRGLPGLADDVVRAIAQEDEASCPEPLEEILDLLELLPAGRELLGLLVELDDDPLHRAHHGDEVVRDAHHVLQALGELGADDLAAAGILDAAHLAVDDGLLGSPVGGRSHADHPTVLVPLDVEEGVDHGLDRDVARGQVFANRVDDERSLADVGADHRDVGLPAVPLAPGVVDRDVHPVRPRVQQEAEGAERHRGEPVVGPPSQQLLGSALEEDLGEGAGALLLTGSGALLDEPADRFDRRNVVPDAALGRFGRVAHLGRKRGSRRSPAGAQGGTGGRGSDERKVDGSEPSGTSRCLNVTRDR